MNNFFRSKVILILSPQPWDYLQISKHHYARALAQRNKVYFVTPPSFLASFSSNVSIKHEAGVQVVMYTVFTPSIVKFRFVKLYKWILKKSLLRVIQKLGPLDVAIDFGCYQQMDSMDFIPSRCKVFFPVDDFESLKSDKRGADLVLTVSKNIQSKFPHSVCHYINHGLAKEFAEKAIDDIKRGKNWTPSQKVNIGYTGNLFIRFIDTEPLIKIIASHRDVQFHFFGSTAFDSAQEWQVRWNQILRSSPNVTLHGLEKIPELVNAYESLDGFLVSYKPDHKNYHGENSHKIMEYLSTGKIVVSTFISVYEGTDLIEMSQTNSDLPVLFDHVISRLSFYNENDKSRRRREFALSNTYENNIEKISRLLLTTNQNLT